MVLFLDFDGVLHPDAVYLEKGRPVLRAEGQLFMWVPLLIEALSEHPHVRVVLSTSWARHFGFSRALKFLPETLRRRAMGATWHSGMAADFDLGMYGSRHSQTWWDRASRYEQIKRYVERAKLQNWIALEDNVVGWAEEDRAHLIQTTSHAGISEPEVLEVLTAQLDAYNRRGR